MSALSPTPAEVAEWTEIIRRALPEDLLSERLALGCMGRALTQAQAAVEVLTAEVEALRAKDAESQRFVQSMKSLMLEHESPAPSGPPRLTVVKVERL